MKQIIVPIDFSENSKSTLTNALIMAQKLDMGLLLMHALPIPTDFTNADMLRGHYKHLQVTRDAAHKQLKQLMRETAKGFKRISFQTIVTFGHISQGLKFIEKHNEVALVVTTSSGTNGFIQSLLGSNSYDIVKDVECPVIVLPADADISKMKNIALAGDYTQLDEPQVLEQLIDISKSFFAKIEVVHVQEEETLDDDQIDIARGLARYLKNVPHSFHFNKYDDVKDGLLSFCEHHDVDMLTVIPRQRTVLERLITSSITKELVHDVPMPLMVLQD